MENSFPKHTIRKDFQNAIFIIKNGTMEDFKRWISAYIKCDVSDVGNEMVFLWLRNIYADYRNAENEVDILWKLIEKNVSIYDEHNVVCTIGTMALWDRLRNLRAMMHLDNGEYKYINGFTEEGIGVIPLAFDEDDMRDTINGIILRTGK